MKPFIIALVFVGIAFSQNIALPPVDFKQKSASVVEALKTRHSVRNFKDTELSNQQIGDICWAAFGVTRDDEHRTAPSALNKKEVRLFVFTKKGTYEYDALSHTLIGQSKGDSRSLIAGTKEFSQDFAKQAPVSFVMVIDFERFGAFDERAHLMGSVDVGNISENINLYCQSVGLATVPRASMDIDGIRKLLKLTEKQLPLINNPVGYENK